MKTPKYLILYFLLSLNFLHAQAISSDEKDFLKTGALRFELDSARVVTVNHLSIKRNVGSFEFSDGVIYFCKPLFGRNCAGIFIGSGIFDLTPPIDVEKEHLYRFYRTRSVNKTFSSMFFVFNDSTFDEIIKTGIKSSNSSFNLAGEYLYSHNKYGIFDDYAFSILNNFPEKYFYASITDKKPKRLVEDVDGAEWKQDPLFFMVDPYLSEEILLLRRNLNDKSGRSREVILQFANNDNRELPSFLKRNVKEHYRVKSYKINASINEDYEFEAKSEMELWTSQSEMDWLLFEHYWGLTVDSVFINGNKASHVKSGSSLWIKTDVPRSAGADIQIIVYYHGDIIKRTGNDFYLRTFSNWYPNYFSDTKSKFDFDITFVIPKNYRIACVGKLVSEKKSKNKYITHWSTQSPIAQASFNFGFFNSYSIKDERIPEVTVFMSQADHAEIGQALVASGNFTGKDMEKQVGSDIANSMAFFQDVYGPSPFENLLVTETSYAHGVAFPGMINLWWKTFQRTEESGFDEFFRAHEVAHQWWGIGVGFETYHDQWLSEGFASYSGLWYLQYILKNNEKFFKFLENYKKDILNNRTGFFEKILGENQQAGPVWLGYRTRTSSTEEDYDLIVYEKGAWVLHMLRNIMIDLNTMNEERFKAMMRDFYQSYVGKHASTEDFKRTVEKHVGSDMSWFFDQWVYGTEIPRYEFAYKTFRLENGKFKTRCQVKQQNVGENFRMPVPVTLDFGDNRLARLRVMIQGPGGEFDLPIMPLEPKKIIFNDFESVLCEVEYVNWKN
jgi:hypothetical protein